MSQDTSFFESSMRRILELERGVAGRSRWDSDIKSDSSLSLLCILISGLFSVSVLLNTESSIDVGGEVTSGDIWIYSTAVALSWLLASWIILISVVKRTEWPLLSMAELDCLGSDRRRSLESFRLSS